MGFWVFMIICNLLIPLTMIGFGEHFKKNCPKEINGAFGYRTTMSMKNKDTWNFAHHHCGKVWTSLGWILLIFSVIIMLLMIGKSESIVGTFGGVLCGVQIIFLIGSIFPTEKALKKNFDEYGRRKHFN